MNNIRACRLAIASIAGAAAITGVGTGNAASAHPSISDPAPVISVHEAHNTFTVAPSKTFEAGRVTFAFTAAQHEHTMQLAKLHKGYSPSDLSRDISAGLEKGNLAAMRRLDHRVTWLGGATSRGGKTGFFNTAVPAGTIWAFDQDGNGSAKFTVTSPKLTRASEPSSVVVRATQSHRWVAPRVLPANGWIKLRNTADQPHFLAMVEVKPGTTGRDVRKYIKSGSQKNPPWALKPGTDSGVFSPGTTTEFQLDLPAGKYLLACFWTDYKTGMPHFNMGMWKLVHLK